MSVTSGAGVSQLALEDLAGPAERQLLDELEAAGRLLGAAEDATVDRVLEAIESEGEQSLESQRRAMVRAYGHLARSAVREWAVKGRLTREQVRLLLHETLLTIAREVLPHLPEEQPPR